MCGENYAFCTKYYVIVKLEYMSLYTKHWIYTKLATSNNRNSYRDYVDPAGPQMF